MFPKIDIPDGVLPGGTGAVSTTGPIAATISIAAAVVPVLLALVCKELVEAERM